MISKGNSTRFLAVAILTLVTLFGCIPAPRPSRARLDIKVYQTDMNVLFMFTRPGLVMRAVRVRVYPPTDEGGRNGTPIWEVVNQLPNHGVTELAYGMTPQDFTLATPRNSAVLTLQPGKQYYVEAVGEDGSRGDTAFVLRTDTGGNNIRIDGESR
jgi:hypothetical protein